MSIKQNSWKTLPFDAVSATVKRLDLQKVFDDKDYVRPNFIQIKNINTSDILYVGDDNTVSSTNYRLAINPLATGKSINMDGYSDIYVLIASNTSKLEMNYAVDPDPSVTDVDGTQDITVINQSLTVGNVGITSIASGTNTIGKMYLTNGSNDMDVESDGSINVNLQAGDNNIGNVDLASSIPSGSNTIGKFKITDGTEDAGIDANNNLYTVLNRLSSGTGDHTLEVESDGSINVNLNAGSNIVGKMNLSQGGNDLVIESDGSINVNGATFNGTIGTVKLEDETGSYYLNIDSNGFITSKLSGSIPAGSNNIGKVTLDNSDAGEIDKPSTTLNIHEITCTTADTEYSQALTSNCKKFTIGLKSKSPDVTWILKDGTSGNEFSLNGAESYTVDNIYLSSLTLYFETDNDDEVIQIIDWS